MGEKPDWEGFGRAVMVDWPEYLPDDYILHELAEEFGLIKKIPGGYNPEVHEVPDWVAVMPASGDDWFVLNYKVRDDC